MSFVESTPTVLSISNATVVQGLNNIFTGVSGKSIYVIGLNITTTTPLAIQSSDGTAVVASCPIGSSGFSSSFIKLPVGVSLVAVAQSSGIASGNILGFVV